MRVTDLNDLKDEQLIEQLEKCCGSSTWVKGMINSAPFISDQDLFQKSQNVWETCGKSDYLQAFSHHPKIGDIDSLKKKYANNSDWAKTEQAGVSETSSEVISALAECNKLYEEKFGYIFIINATGKSAEEILGSLRWRLLNLPEDELHIAAQEQSGITQIRLEKLLS